MVGGTGVRDCLARPRPPPAARDAGPDREARISLDLGLELEPGFAGSADVAQPEKCGVTEHGLRQSPCRS